MIGKRWRAVFLMTMLAVSVPALANDGGAPYVHNTRDFVEICSGKSGGGMSDAAVGYCAGMIYAIEWGFRSGTMFGGQVALRSMRATNFDEFWPQVEKLFTPYCVPDGLLSGDLTVAVVGYMATHENV